MAHTIATLEREQAALQRRIDALQMQYNVCEAQKAALRATHGDYGTLQVVENPYTADGSGFAVVERVGGGWYVQTKTRQAACYAAEFMIDRLGAAAFDSLAWATPGCAPPEVLDAMRQARGLFGGF